MIEDDALRRRALDALGALGDDLAREALELGTVEVERGVASWEGSLGVVRADRVTLVVPAAVRERIAERPAAGHALEAALAVAVAQEERTSLYALQIEAGFPEGTTRGPYR